MIRMDRLDADRAGVLIIDLQEKLLPLIRDADRILTATECLLNGAREFDIPLMATEQYVRGLGPTCRRIGDLLQEFNATVVEKPTFSACGHEPVRKLLRDRECTQILIAGVEAHICVLQTALDLAAMDYQVYVCADAIGSRGQWDMNMALERMRHAGITVGTVDSALFEICNRCDTERFKALLPHIKAKPRVS